MEVEQVPLGVLSLFFHQLPTADDDVSTFLVDLEDDGPDVAADEFTDVAGTSDVHLAGGQEHGDADVDQQAALDLPHALAFDDVAFGSGSQDLFPSSDAIGLALREHDRAAFVFGALEQDFDFVSGLEIDGAVVEFGLGDEAFALETDVDHDEVTGESDDLAAENGSGGETVHVLAEQRVHVASRDVIAEGGAEKRFGLEIFDPEVFDKVVVDHVWWWGLDLASSKADGRIRPGDWCECGVDARRLDPLVTSGPDRENESESIGATGPRQKPHFPR